MRGRTTLNLRTSNPSRARFAGEPQNSRYSAKVIPSENRSRVTTSNPPPRRVRLRTETQAYVTARVAGRLEAARGRMRDVIGSSANIDCSELDGDELAGLAVARLRDDHH